MVFSIPSYLCTGDRPKAPVDARSGGGVFIVPWPKSGKGPDAFIEKTFPYIWNGERGGDAETTRRREQLESKKKNITPSGFLPVGPPSRGEGLGSYYGCIQSSPHPHMAEHPVTHTEAASRREPAPRGIFTSPPAKGGYGYAKLALSDVGAAYMASVYDQPRLNAKAEQRAARAKMQPEPFRPCGRRGFTFDESAMTGVSRCYIMTVPFAVKRPEKVFTHFYIASPWRPAGFVNTAPPRLEYMEDPYDGYDPREDPKKQIKKPSEWVFKPSSCSDTFWYTQSVVFKRL